MKRLLLFCCLLLSFTLASCNPVKKLTSFRLEGDIFTQRYIIKGDALPELRLIGAYNDDTEDEGVTVTSNMVKGFDSTKTGKQKVRVIFQNLEVAFDVFVVDKAIVSTEELNAAKESQADGEVWYIKGGMYRTSLEIFRKLTIFGSDVEETVIQGPLSYEDIPLTAKVGSETMDYHSIVTIKDTKEVFMSNIIVAGDITQASMANIRANRYCGVLILNASAHLEHVTIKDITFPEGVLGIQNGTGIYLAASEENHEVEIANSVVTNFSKTGILIRPNFANVIISNCLIEGVGPTDKIAQNGIQFASKVNINNTTIKELVYSPETVFSCGLLGVYAPYDECTYTENIFVNVQKEIDITSFVNNE